MFLLRYTLTSDLLAEKKVGNNQRAFKRTLDGRVLTHIATWDWAIKLAVRELRLTRVIDVRSIRPEPSWVSPVTALFTRTYMQGGVSMREMFEAIPEGAHLEHRDLFENR